MRRAASPRHPRPRSRRGRLPDSGLPGHSRLGPWLHLPVDLTAEFEAELHDIRRPIKTAAGQQERPPPCRIAGSSSVTRVTLQNMPDPAVCFFLGRDGVRLAYREVGRGRPLVLLHGVAGDGTLWLRYGHAETIAARGHRVIMPDFRGHGRSEKPHDAVRCPPDVLADDGLALLEHLGLDDYDLGGYSLGARIVVRMLVRGATPRRAVVAGQGLHQVLGVGGGAGSFLRRVFAGAGTFEPGSPEEQAEQSLRANGADPVALLHVLDSLVATPVEALGRIRVPALVVLGTDDERAVSADELVAALPHGTRAVVPGNHGTAAGTPELTAAILDFLADPQPPVRRTGAVPE